MKKFCTLLTILLAGFALSMNAQTSSNQKLPGEQLAFYTGKWNGKGEFASGRKIEADITFAPALDSAWLVQTHIDKAPNTYKAVSYWGIDPQTKQPLTTLFDNFNGQRQFQSTTEGNKITLSCSVNDPKRGLYYQHFIYEKLSENSFKMTFEMSKDGNTWKMVDYLIFERVKV